MCKSIKITSCSRTFAIGLGAFAYINYDKKNFQILPKVSSMNQQRASDTLRPRPVSLGEGSNTIAKSTSSFERSDEPATIEKGPEQKDDAPAIPGRSIGLALCSRLSFMPFLYLRVFKCVCPSEFLMRSVLFQQETVLASSQPPWFVKRRGLGIGIASVGSSLGETSALRSDSELTRTKVESYFQYFFIHRVMERVGFYGAVRYTALLIGILLAASCFLVKARLRRKKWNPDLKWCDITLFKEKAFVLYTFGSYLVTFVGSSSVKF